MGLTLRALHRPAEAEDHLNRAAWDFAWRAASYYELAELAVARQDLDAALELLEQSVGHNTYNNQAHCLMALVLRALGRPEEAQSAIDTALRQDPLDFRARQERCLLLHASGRPDDAKREERYLLEMMRNDTQSHMELASDYAKCGRFQEAADVLTRFVESTDGPVDPMVQFTLAYYMESLGDSAGASRHRETAGKLPSEYCFPSRLESIEVLRSAIAANPLDARAPYYLGNLLFDIQPR